ncbi:BCD family MFS transporter [Sphingomonas sp. 1P06PA]|uniref:BCD family MFS transporter n=1 Tax=Sphingomonas sp. 1P06PA TaxID=554121 RepID=UPI0039A4CC53
MRPSPVTIAIVRLGLVQSAIGALVMVATSLLNRIMVVEYALPAALPAGLVAWHYAVQLSRPLSGHGSDRGRRRTPWIVGGMALLALGTLLAVDAVLVLGAGSAAGLLAAILAFSMIGAGVGAAGTSLLALLAATVPPERRAAAAATTWIMMVAGIAISAGVAGSLIDPFTPARLASVAGTVALAAFLLALAAVHGVERAALPPPPADAPVAFRAALAAVWQDAPARRFTLFVFMAMLAYAMQDLILEPFAGLRFGYTPGESTRLAGVQHGAVMLGMIATGLAGRHARGPLLIVAGCIGSALALAGLAAAALAGPGWPLAPTIALLGFANGVFAVAAIGAMMALASAGQGSAGIRMGLWGAAQAIAFGCGGLLGAIGVDALRTIVAVPTAFLLVFAGEALLFLAAAWIATRVAPAPRVMLRKAMA